jgi:hypothetical protein
MFAKRMQSDRRVSVGTTGTHLVGDPDCLHDLLVARTHASNSFRVAGDAVRALRDVGHRDGNQLPSFFRKCACSEDGPAEPLEGPKET